MRNSYRELPDGGAFCPGELRDRSICASGESGEVLDGLLR